MDGSLTRARPSAPAEADAAETSTGLGGARLRTGLAVVFWGSVSVLLAAWVALYLTLPFSVDQGAIAWVADVIVAGGMPYRDAWDVKGPMAYYPVALVNAVFGRNFWGLRVFDLLVITVGMVHLYRVGRSFTTRAFGLLSVVTFLLWYSSLAPGDTAQPDGWASVLLTVVAAILLAMAARLRIGAGILVGALIGVAVLIKPTYVLFLAMPFVYALALPQAKEDRRNVFRFWAAAAVGTVLPIVVAVAWFASHDALAAWLDIHANWLPRVYTYISLPWPERITRMTQVLSSQPLAPALPFALAGLWFARQRDQAGATMLGVWVAVGLLTVLVQGKVWPYLWSPLYPPLAVLSAIGIHGMWRMVMVRSSVHGLEEVRVPTRLIVLCLAAILFVSAARPTIARLWRAKAVAFGGPSDSFEETEYGEFGRGPGSLARVAAHVRDRTRPGDGVLMWGMSGAVNFLSDRPSPTRFGVNPPLLWGVNTPQRSAYREEFMREIAVKPPAYVVTHVLGCTPEDMETGIGEFPHFADFLARGYHLELDLGCVRVLRANSGLGDRNPS